MRRRLAPRWSVGLAALAATLLTVTLAVGPAGAVTNGTLDGDGHPYVGLMVAKDASGAPLWRCSGTLLSPTVYLTAGHCTESPAASAEIWFGDDLTDAAAINYPTQGDVSGKTYLHPGFDPDDFSYRDVGVVVLDEPYVLPTYGALPTPEPARRPAHQARAEGPHLHGGRLRAAAVLPGRSHVEEREQADAHGRDPQAAAGQHRVHR